MTTANKSADKRPKLSEVETFSLKPRYESNSRGVFWVGIKTSRDGETAEAEPVRLSDAIELMGSGQDSAGRYYRVIRYRDKITGKDKTAALAAADIGSNQSWAHLQGLGLTVLSGKAKREKLADYL